VLGSYIKQNMRFFVAKVNLERMEQIGGSYLRPLQVRYETPKFMLPLRLGTVNANGPQDLIIYALSRNGRVETANYRTVKLPSDIDVPLFVKRTSATSTRRCSTGRSRARTCARCSSNMPGTWAGATRARPIRSATRRLVELGARWIASDDDKPFRSRAGRQRLCDAAARALRRAESSRKTSC
jgi:hypothetical protein